ncbi:hypothetical protein [Paraburkholderia hiiakae]|uniref:hypothetical protein n=1 Tax=Paraburkholderia hiiakae TaxID=1081782 RepID=UPI001919B6A0|nr:hypothetical protein [Paraburkholderia hiiakae]
MSDVKENPEAGADEAALVGLVTSRPQAALATLHVARCVFPEKLTSAPNGSAQSWV